jgi:hypothetical protein
MPQPKPEPSPQLESAGDMHDGFIYAGFGGLLLYIFYDIVGGWLDSRERKSKKPPEDE